MTSPQAFFLTAHFSEEDYPYEWLMLWLSRRPEWQRSREFETTTNSSSPGYYGYRESDNAFGDEEISGGGGGDEEVSGKTRMRVVFQPTTDTTHTIFYRGHWLRVRRGRKSNGYEMLSIRYARPRTRGPLHSVVPPADALFATR
jgi:chaperone BCS1